MTPTHKQPSSPTEPDEPRDSVIDRLRRIRDILLGREPSLLTEIKADTATIKTDSIADHAAIVRIESVVTDIRELIREPLAANLGLQGGTVTPKTPLPPPPAPPKTP